MSERVRNVDDKGVVVHENGTKVVINRITYSGNFRKGQEVRLNQGLKGSTK